MGWKFQFSAWPFLLPAWQECWKISTQPCYFGNLSIYNLYIIFLLWGACGHSFFHRVWLKYNGCIWKIFCLASHLFPVLWLVRSDILWGFVLVYFVFPLSFLKMFYFLTAFMVTHEDSIIFHHYTLVCSELFFSNTTLTILFLIFGFLINSLDIMYLIHVISLFKFGAI